MSAMKAAILALVEELGGVSFVDLGRRIEGFNGDREYYLADTEIVIWGGMSPEAIESLNALMDEKKIVPKDSNLLVYLIDGQTLRLPLAKGKRKYKTPHWAPIVFWTPTQLADLKSRGLAP